MKAPGSAASCPSPRAPTRAPKWQLSPHTCCPGPCPACSSHRAGSEPAGTGQRGPPTLMLLLLWWGEGGKRHPVHGCFPSWGTSGFLCRRGRARGQEEEEDGWVCRHLPHLETPSCKQPWREGGPAFVGAGDLGKEGSVGLTRAAPPCTLEGLVPAQGTGISRHQGRFKVCAHLTPVRKQFVLVFTALGKIPAVFFLPGAASQGTHCQPRNSSDVTE